MSSFPDEIKECVNWVNGQLPDEEPITDVLTGLSDGTKLIRIVAKLSGKKALRYSLTANTPFQKQQNMAVLLKMTEMAYGTNVSYDAGDLARGNEGQLLSLAFYIGQKSGTRVPKRKTLTKATSIGLKNVQPNANEQVSKNSPLRQTSDVALNHTEKTQNKNNTNGDETDKMERSPRSPRKVVIDVVPALPEKRYHNISSSKTVVQTRDIKETTDSTDDGLDIPVDVIETTLTSQGVKEKSQTDLEEESPIKSDMTESTENNEEGSAHYSLYDEIEVLGKYDTFMETNKCTTPTVSESSYVQPIVDTSSMCTVSTGVVESEALHQETPPSQLEDVPPPTPTLPQRPKRMLESSMNKLCQSSPSAGCKSSREASLSSGTSRMSFMSESGSGAKRDKIGKSPRDTISQMPEMSYDQKTYLEEDVDIINKYCRGYLGRLKAKPTMKMLSQRRNVVLEILNTERIYVSRLKQFLEFYLAKALQIFPGDSILKKCEENLRVIVGYNGNLLKELEQLQTEGKIYGEGIGKSFEKLSHFLKTYCSYINSTDAINEHEEKLRRTKKEFESQMKQTQLENKLETFNSYVILPVQRIPRYRLLLTELLKTMTPQHGEYIALDKSLQQIIEVGSAVNETKRTMEQKNIVSLVFSKFKYPTGMQQIQPDAACSFVRIGNMELLDREKGKLKSVTLLLFSNNVVITKVPTTGTLHKGKLKADSIETIVESKKSLTVEYVIPIGSFCVLDSADFMLGSGGLSERAPSFKIVTKDLLTFQFCTLTESEKNSWLVDLDSQVALVQERALIGIRESNKNIIESLYDAYRSQWSENTIKMPWWHSDLMGEECMIFANGYVATFGNAHDAFARQNIRNYFVTKYTSVAFSGQKTITLVNFARKEKPRVVLELNTTAEALMWVFLLRQSFIGFYDPNEINMALFSCAENDLPALPPEEVVFAITENAKNRTCADCGDTAVKYVDMTFGCFVCSDCGRIHRYFTNKPQVCAPKILGDKSLVDLRLLIQKGNDFLNEELVVGQGLPTNPAEYDGDLNQYLWKKYKQEGEAPKSIIREVGKKTGTLRRDEVNKIRAKRGMERRSTFSVIEEDKKKK
ncbi:Rho/RAC guanine nucleotide exchange factor, putative [Entamoeba invadens IP1]|uniref:Rho/RAC guanine nucleotide exchange factor, putative n=1 Tax=Entamoeba invadens IP1 TaxID=370355 RepID=A0A0A1U318_ENTIV|nr:Rho/RAC guanine nucleotide exchange factor, putative [Entamoeba invadens IP1]ELP87100.1 Rho/RAC guanine nucleotide exchange factor, putative [Entamoeba invadens IP1]|eukprot:XP_004253871.1 Rho/RAC guanine nucleotide exchange factor, putative [Entamoeba invadens IP1]